ncbi:MAG: peptide ABC transporter substrate-binding protein [Spirochaetaceae bacterium]|nr:MAG: peptide ABC transporter substrate-binding protein [Spirochaetaceae bacterium]
MRKLVLLLIALCLALPAFAVDFRVANGSEPASLDPHLVSGTVEHRIYMSLFEGIMTYDPQTNNPIYGLAQSHKASADNLTWTFTLRPGLVWSDGTPITAQQVVDSWLRCLDPNTGAEYASLLTDVIKGAAEFNAGTGPRSGVAVRALDSRTFQFNTKIPAPYVVSMLAHYAFAVVPTHAIAKYGDQWTLPRNFVGSGPFVLKEWKPQEIIIVEKNPRYWGARNVKLDRVLFYPSDSYTTTYNMYIKGEVDWNVNPAPPELMDAAKLRKDYHLVPQLGTYYYQFNQTKPPFDDVRVRKAFSMSINRQELCDKITKGGQVPAFAYTPEFAGYVPPKGIGENVEQAKRLLAEAGYPGGAGFPTVTILYNTSEAHKKIAEYFQQKWEQTLGVKVQLNNQEWATYLDTRKMQQFDLCRAGWIADYQDPFNFLFMWLSDNLDFNDGRYKNTRYDQLVRQANSMPGGPERNKVFAQAETILIDQDQGIMPIYYYVSQNFIDKNKWGGWYDVLLDNHPYWSIYKK